MKKFIFLFISSIIALSVGIRANAMKAKDTPPTIDSVHYYIADTTDCSTLTVAGNNVLPNIPIYVTGFKGIISTQFSVSYDTTIFTFSTIKYSGSISGFNVSKAGKIGNILTLAFNWIDQTGNGITLADGSNIITLSFLPISVYNTKLPITISNYPVNTFYNSTDNLQNAIYTYGTGGSYNLFSDTTKLSVLSKTSICAGDSVLLMSNYSSNNIWDYDPNANVSSTSFGTAIPNATGQTYYAHTSGSYRLQNTSSVCVGRSAWQYITVNPIPPTPVVAGNDIYLCTGDTATLSTNTIDPNAQTTAYQWYQNSLPVTGATSSTFQTKNSGSYSVAILGAGGCNSTSSVNTNVSVLTRPQALIINPIGSTSLCPTGADTLTSSSGLNYFWYKNGIQYINSTSNQTIPVYDPGIYTATTMASYIQYNKNCVSSPSNSIIISSGGIATPSITTSGAHSICLGGYIVLNATAGFNTYQWYLNDSAILGGTQPSYTAFITGNYTVKCSMGSINCNSTSLPFTVTIANSPTPSIAVNSNTTICNGDSLVLTGSSNSYIAYQWYLNGGIINGATNQVYYAKSSGIYTLKANNSSGCLSAASSGVSITVNPSPGIPTITNTGTNNVCAGSSVNLYSSLANSYQWKLNGSAIPNATSQSYIVNNSGNYTVSVSNSYGCTSSSSTSTITLINKTTPTVSASGNTTFCSGGSTQLNTSGYASYQWYLNGALIPGATSSSFIANNQGSYTVIGTTNEGCPSNTSSPLTVTVYNNPTTPVLTTNGPPTICSGNGVTLNANTSATYYQWYYNGSPVYSTSVSNYTALYPGTYSVVTTNSSNCVSQTSNTIVINAGNTTIPTINNNGKTSVCKGDSILLTASAGSSYQWLFNGGVINNASNQSIYASSNGYYSVSVTNQSGCVATSSSIPLSVLSLPTASISYTNTVICPGGNIVLNAVASNPLSEQWYFNGTPVSSNANNAYTASNPGTYTLVVTDQNSCKSVPSNAVVLSQGNTPSTPTITANSNPTICPGTNVILSTNNSYSAYQWSVNGNAINGATNYNYQATTAGNYSVVVTNSSGCNSVASSAILVTLNAAPNNPTITNSSSNNLCSGSSLTLTSSLAYSYQWSLNGNTINNANGQSYQVNTGGNYGVTITNSFGCTASNATYIYLIAKTTPSVSASGNTAFCTGGNVQLNTYGYNSYQWYVDGNIINGATNPSYNASTSGNYTVIGTTSDGCLSYASSPVTVTVFSNPNTPVLSAGGNTTVCSGAAVTLNSTSDFAYAWYLNGNLVYLSKTPSYQVTTAGSYSIKTSNSYGCNSAFSNSVAVTAITPVIPTITNSGNSTICSGDTTLLTSTSGSSYQWFLNGFAINNTNNDSLYATANGNYSVAVTYPSGCTATSANSTITVSSTPTPAIAYNSSVICPGSSISLSTSNSYYSYQWYFNNNPIANSNSNTYQASSAGSYTVVVTNSIECHSVASQPATLTMSSTPATPTVTTNNSTSFCPGGTAVLSGFNQAYATYQWLKDGAPISGASYYTYSANTSGNYAVIATNSNGCYSDTSAPIAVNVYPTPNTPTITNSNSANLCIGSYLFLTSSLASGYQWYLNGTIIPGVTTQALQVTNGGTYTVMVNNSYGCTASSSTNINLIQKITPIIALAGNGRICAGDSILLNAYGLATYQWYLNGNPTGATTGQTYVKLAGNYTVAGTTIDGCNSNTSLPVSINVINKPNTPVLSANGSTTFCAGSQVTLNSTNEYAYSWYNNGTLINNTTNPFYSVATTGNYTVVTTNTSGCTSDPSNTINVTVNVPAIPAIIASGNTTICAGDSVLLTTNAGSSYQWYLNGNTINNSNSQSIHASVSGNYSVTVTYPTSCSATSSNITVYTISTNTPAISYNSSIICPGSTNTLNATTGYTSYQWFLDGYPLANNNYATLSAAYAGNYTVVGTNTFGCSSKPSAIAAITMSTTPPTPYVYATATSFCKGDTVVLSTAPGYQYQWYLNGNAINSNSYYTYPATQSGSYSVIVTNNSGCSSTASTALNLQQYPSVTPGISTSGSTSICTGNTVTLSTAVGNAYQWYFNSIPVANATNQFFVAAASGAYLVKVKDSYGCSSISNATTVNVTTVPPPAIGTVGNLNICAGDSTELIASNGYNSYQWYLNGNAVNGANGIYLITKTAGTYTVTGTASSGCTSVASANAIVTVSSAPATPGISANAAGICIGGNVLLTSSPASSYQWYINGNPIIGANSQTFTAFTDGIYNVVAYSYPNCASALSTNVAIANYSTTPTVYSSGKLTFCNNDTTLLTASAGISYQWYNNGIIIPGATSQTYIADSAGQYYVAVTNQNNCTSNTSKVTINVNGASIPGLTSTAANICSGNNATLTTSIGYASYHWFINGALIPNASSYNYTTQTAGTYTVVATTSMGCSTAASLPYTINVWQLPATPVISTNGLTTACNGNSVALASTPAYSYQWYNNNTAILNTNSQSLLAYTQGSYTVNAIDINGCSSARSNAVAVTINPIPNTPLVLYTGNTTICNGNTAVLSTTSASTYQWYNGGIAIPGATNQTYSATAAGAYSVQTFNTYSCGATSATTTINTVYGPTPNINVIGTTSFCPGKSVILQADSGYASYKWYNNGTLVASNTNRSYTITSSGNFSLIATATGGCASNATAAITTTLLAAPAAPAILPAGNVAICKNATLTLSGPVANNYQWYRNGTAINGAVYSSYTISDAATYSLMVTNSGGCSTLSNNNAISTIDSSVATIATPTKTSFCLGDSVALTASSSNSYQWYKNGTIINAATARTYQAKASGIYTVNTTNANTCVTNSAAVTITVNSSAAPSVFTSGPTTYCSNNAVTTLNGTPGNNYYQWTRNDTIITGATASAYSPVTSGVYKLISYNTGSCPSTPSTGVGITIIQTPSKPVIISGNGTQICSGNNILLISSSGTSYQWYKNGILLSGAIAQTYNVTNAGYYSVQNINSGCASILSDSINIQRLVNPGFSVNNVSQELCTNNFIFTTNNPSSVNKYYWSFGDSTSATTINASHVYTTKNFFTVKQIVSSPNNSCIDSASQTVAVTKCTYAGVTESDSISVYPNPTNGVFKLRFLCTTARQLHLAVISENGVVFIAKDLNAVEGKNYISFDLSSPVYKNGGYVITLTSGDIRYDATRFILRH